LDEENPYGNEMITLEISYKIMEFIYNLIETLLPKASLEHNPNNNLKMMEL
jgi:hypothetical protein